MGLEEKNIYLKNIQKRDFRVASAIESYTIKYLWYTLNRATVNSWKEKFVGNQKAIIKRVGRPHLFDNILNKKVKGTVMQII